MSNRNIGSRKRVELRRCIKISCNADGRLILFVLFTRRIGSAGRITSWTLPWNVS